MVPMTLLGATAGRRRVLGAAAAVYLACVAAVVLWPTPVDRPAAGTLTDLFRWLHEHGAPLWVSYGLLEWLSNVAFFVPFGLLAVLFGRRVRVAVAAAAVFSGAIEITQWAALPERTGSLLDVAANTAGALVGAVAASWWSRRAGKPPRMVAGPRSQESDWKDPMALEATTTLNYPVDQVAAVFADEAFQRHVSELVGGKLESFAVEGELAGAFTATVVRQVPTGRLPEIAKKFVGEYLNVTQVEAWTAPEADGSRQADIKVKIAGAPVDVAAVQRLAADGSKTRIELSGKVSSSVPLLGGKIADAAEPMVSKALNLEATQAEAWLAGEIV